MRFPPELEDDLRRASGLRAPRPPCPAAFPIPFQFTLRSTLLFRFLFTFLFLLFQIQSASAQAVPEPPGDPLEPPPAGWAAPGATTQPRLRSILPPPQQPQPQPIMITSSPDESSPVPLAEQARARTAEEHRRSEAARHAALGQRHRERRDYEPAARELALSYVLDPRPERLLGAAQALRRADLDLEAFAAFQRLQADAVHATDTEASEIGEALAVLRAKTEDAEVLAPRLVRSHMERGRQRFQENQFLAAAGEYALAYVMKPLPRLLFNIAQVFRRSGQVDAAYILYARFLAEEPRTPLRKEAVGYLDELRAVAFRPPLYRRAWFWSVLGATAAALIAGSAGLAVGLKPTYPATDLPPQILTFGLRN